MCVCVMDGRVNYDQQSTHEFNYAQKVDIDIIMQKFMQPHSLTSATDCLY